MLYSVLFNPLFARAVFGLDEKVDVSEPNSSVFNGYPYREGFALHQPVGPNKAFWINFGDVGLGVCLHVISPFSPELYRW